MYCVTWHQQKCYIFASFDEYNLFDILLLLFTFLIFNLVFNHFFVIFHIFLGKYTPLYLLIYRNDIKTYEIIRKMLLV